MPKPKKIQYNGDSKVIAALANVGNWLLDNTLSAIPIASSNSLGGIKVGQNLTIENDGTLNAQAGGSDVSVTPILSSGTKIAEISVTEGTGTDSYDIYAPTPSTVYNSTITIRKNGTDVGSFTLNQSSADNINITVPTNTSDLTNDSGYITSYTDEKITAEEKNPTSEKTYNIPFTDGTTNQKPFINDGIKFRTLQGTSGSSGIANLALGNDIASGTAGNKYGNLRIYSRSQYFMNVIPVNNLTANRTFTLPDKSGTAATTDDIPTVNNSTITIKKNGTTVDSFTLNQSSAKDIDISVPTKTSDLTNDSGFITSYTDEKVKQENTTTDADYRVLFSNGANDTTETKTARKSGELKFNPSGKCLYTTFYNGMIYNRVVVDASTLDQNTYYPVVASMNAGAVNGYVRMRIFVHLNSGTKPSWSTHSNGFSVHLDILNVPSGWGTSDAKGICLANTFNHCSESPCGYSQMANGSVAVFWVRGGGKYILFSDRKMEWSLKTSAYTNNNQTVQPQATNPGVSLPYLGTIKANIDGNATSATKASQNASGVAFSPLAVLGLGTGSSKFLREDGTWQTVTATWSGGTVTSDILPSGTVNLGASNKVFSNLHVNTINAYGAVFTGTANSARGQIGFRQHNSAYSHYLYANATALTSDQLYYMPSTGGTLVTDNNCKVGKLLNYVCAALNTEYTVTLAEAYTNYDLIVMTSYQHNGGVSATGRVGGPACIVPSALAYNSNTAYTHQVTQFGSVYFSSATQVKVKCVSNVAYGILIFGIKFGSTPSSW